jgi:hypothetical protein
MLARILLGFSLCCWHCQAGVVATWLFDEQTQSYPSTVLNDCGPNGYVLVLGRGGHLVPGRFGNALEALEPETLKMSGTMVQSPGSNAVLFGLTPLPIPQGRKIQPLWWQNADFAAMFTSGERHLRSSGFANPSDSKLNLGNFDWTVEFWYRGGAAAKGGTVFEIGSGPRGENDLVTRLSLAGGARAFEFINQPAGIKLVIPTNAKAVNDREWHHLVFVYSAATAQMSHFVDGRQQPLPARAAIKALPHGEEAYFSIARDGLWEHPLPGAIDELRVRDDANHAPPAQPETLSLTYSGKLPPVELAAGPPLLFGKLSAKSTVVELATRKHLFIDDSLIAENHGIMFQPNPPRRAAKVADEVRGHLSVVEDETGMIRLYYQGTDDALAVMTSRDGLHWEKPITSRTHSNLVSPKSVGLGAVFIDPNAPPESRYKYVSGVRRRGVFVFSSSDGFWFEPHETSALPFSSGSQSAAYYDDQRQVYVFHHRSDYGMTPGGTTSRRFVMSEVKDLLEPWPFTPATEERTREAGLHLRIQSSKLDPWFLDNGPLAPGGFGIELPTIMGTDEAIDPPGTDIYVTKAIKYPWAPDTYLAFPAVYFHYDRDGPESRRILASKGRNRGSGVVETQLAVSRDGLEWKRYPHPVYVPIGGDGSNAEHMLFMTHGIVRRGNELWQFVGGHGGSGTGYHSPIGNGEKPAPLYLYKQRLDGFVAAEAPYTGGEMITRPLRFTGNRLLLNIDTGAVGYAQVGFVDEASRPIAGFSIDDCIYINGDFINTPVEWLHKGKDLSPLEGKTVRIVFRMRASKLFAMQFARE